MFPATVARSIGAEKPNCITGVRLILQYAGCEDIPLIDEDVRTKSGIGGAVGGALSFLQASPHNTTPVKTQIILNQ